MTMSGSSRGEWTSNGNFTFREFEKRVSQTGINRKLEGIRRDLVLLGEQGKARGFFSNVQNADKLGGLVEDIRDAIMDYQVCCINSFVSFVLKTITRHHCNKICTTEAPYSSWAPHFTFCPH